MESVVDESWASGPLPLVPEAISMVPDSTAAASSSNSSSRQFAGLVDALQQHVERDLLHDEAAITPLVVDVVRIPLAEMVVGPLVHRMVEIVGPRMPPTLPPILSKRTSPKN